MAQDTLKRARPDESSDKAAVSDEEAEEYVASQCCPFPLIAAAVYAAVKLRSLSWHADMKNTYQ